MNQTVKEFVQACTTCQQNKAENLTPARLLQPLPIREQIWLDISMDFVEGLPNSKGKSVIFAVVDRLSKSTHFLALSHPYTAISVAHVLFHEIFRLHGLP